MGRICNLFYSDEIPFHGVMDFIKKMEPMLEQMNFPQSFSSVRTFAKAPEEHRMMARNLRELSQHCHCVFCFGRIPAGMEVSLGWKENVKSPSEACWNY